MSATSKSGGHLVAKLQKYSFNHCIYIYKFYQYIYNIIYVSVSDIVTKMCEYIHEKMY